MELLKSKINTFKFGFVFRMTHNDDLIMLVRRLKDTTATTKKHNKVSMSYLNV